FRRNIEKKTRQAAHEEGQRDAADAEHRGGNRKSRENATESLWRQVAADFPWNATRRGVPIEERPGLGIGNEMQRQQNERQGEEAQSQSAQEQAQITGFCRSVTGVGSHRYS